MLKNCLPHDRAKTLNFACNCSSGLRIPAMATPSNTSLRTDSSFARETAAGPGSAAASRRRLLRSSVDGAREVAGRPCSRQARCVSAAPMASIAAYAAFCLSSMLLILSSYFHIKFRSPAIRSHSRRVLQGTPRNLAWRCNCFWRMARIPRLPKVKISAARDCVGSRSSGFGGHYSSRIFVAPGRETSVDVLRRVVA